MFEDKHNKIWRGLSMAVVDNNRSNVFVSLDLVSLSLVAALSVFFILMVVLAIACWIRFRKNVSGRTVRFLKLFVTRY